MTGPLSLKSICFKCKINKWIVDFKEGCAAKISTTSVCLACEHAIKIEKLEKTIQEKDVIIKKMTALVENLGKKVEALETKRLLLNDKNSSHEIDDGKSSTVQETVKMIENAVKENMDIIADNGRAIVELRNDLVKIVNEPGFQKANGRMVAKHSKKESKVVMELSNRYAALSQEELCLIGDSIVKDQRDHFINKNKQRRKLKSFPGARVKKVTEEVKRLDQKSSRCIIVHAGSNDLCLRNNKTSYSEPVVKELETLADCISEKTERGFMIGLLPRIYSSHLEMSKAIGINERMKKYCQQKGVKFIDVWNIFIGRKHFFKYDGIHLSTLGNIKLGEILSKNCEESLSGNASALIQNHSPGQEITAVSTDNSDSSFLGFPQMV